MYDSGDDGSVGEESYILLVEFAVQASHRMAKRRGYSPTETQTRLKSQEAAVRLSVFDVCRDARW